MYIITCKESGEQRTKTKAQIIDMINADRSDGWSDYDETDWEEGWEVWMEHEWELETCDV